MMDDDTFTALADAFDAALKGTPQRWIEHEWAAIRATRVHELAAELERRGYVIGRALPAPDPTMGGWLDTTDPDRGYWPNPSGAPVSDEPRSDDEAVEEAARTLWRQACSEYDYDWDSNAPQFREQAREVLAPLLAARVRDTAEVEQLRNACAEWQRREQQYRESRNEWQRRAQQYAKARDALDHVVGMLQRDALTAYARGKSEAERRALDILAVIESYGALRVTAADDQEADA